MSTGTVSNVLNHPERVVDVTRANVLAAIAELGFVRGQADGEIAAHWRRNGFATWLFAPAVSGWYPRKAPHDARPVPLLADRGRRVPARGRNAGGRADACRVPVAPGLTPHGRRHSHRTLMVEPGTPAVLRDTGWATRTARSRGRYSHVTADMQPRLLDGLTAGGRQRSTSGRRCALDHP
ncbi:LacI family DNA-binding transcriptional regulator [Actinosynnema sp. NPDC004786]